MAHRYRARARRLVNDTGEDAAKLAALLETDLMRLAGYEAALAAAQASLTAAVREGKAEAWGHRCDHRGNPVGNGEIEVVPSHIFFSSKQPRTISWFSKVELPQPLSFDEILRADGPFFDGVTFEALQIRALWPSGQALAHVPNTRAKQVSFWMAADDAADHWIALHGLGLGDEAAQQAADALLSVWGAGKLEVFGIPDVEVGKPDPKAAPQKVAPEMFTLSAVTVRNNRLERGSAGTMDDFMAAYRPLFSNLKMRRTDVLRIWPSPAPNAEAVVDLMLKHAKEYFERYKAKPKRADLIQRCVAELRCRHEDAETAYLELPAQYRRSRGEKDR